MEDGITEFRVYTLPYHTHTHTHGGIPCSCGLVDDS